jgi:phosphate starvation-inducible PhoH-like protein
MTHSAAGASSSRSGLPPRCPFSWESPLSKRPEKQKRRTRRGSADVIELHPSKFMEERSAPPILPLNPTQSRYLDALKVSQQTLVLGPAGTGKTWLAATYAADLYRSRRISRIILTRPNVPCGRSLGFFPGSLEDKFAPWATPLVDAIKERIGAAAFGIAQRAGEIEMVPFEVMRGRSWSDAFILLDEAQNASIAELKLLLTRIGENARLVINGDVEQCDLQQSSGLATIVGLVRSRGLPVPIIEFTMDDIVRSGACEMWVRAFAQARL